MIVSRQLAQFPRFSRRFPVVRDRRRATINKTALLELAECSRARRQRDQQTAMRSALASGELSRDIPAVWEAAGTMAADRKEIIRLLVERVIV